MYEIDWATKWNVASTKQVICWQYLDSRVCPKELVMATVPESIAFNLGDLDRAMKAGYGHFGAVWSIKLHKGRN